MGTPIPVTQAVGDSLDIVSTILTFVTSNAWIAIPFAAGLVFIGWRILKKFKK